MGVWVLIVSAVCVLNCVDAKWRQRIFHGIEDSTGKYPHVVALLYTAQKSIGLFRGGSATVIKSQWVITVAHCVRENLDYVQYGDMSLTPDQTKSKKRVYKKIPHPQFQKLVEGFWAINDIALLRIETLELKSFVQFSSIDYSETFELEVTYAGFGVNQTNKATQSEIMKKMLCYGEGVLNKCPGTLDWWRPSGTYLCVTSIVSTLNYQHSMPGDSGGPLYHDGKLIGVLVGHCRTVVPTTAFTPIYRYMPWIRNEMSIPFNSIETK